MRRVSMGGAAIAGKSARTFWRLTGCPGVYDDVTYSVVNNVRCVPCVGRRAPLLSLLLALLVRPVRYPPQPAGAPGRGWTGCCRR